MAIAFSRPLKWSKKFCSDACAVFGFFQSDFALSFLKEGRGEGRKAAPLDASCAGGEGSARNRAPSTRVQAVRGRLVGEDMGAWMVSAEYLTAHL